MKRLDEETVIEDHFIARIQFKRESSHEDIEENSCFDKSEMLTNAISRASVEWNESEWGYC